jgi:hypothetical protein
MCTSHTDINTSNTAPSAAFSRYRIKAEECYIKRNEQIGATWCLMGLAQQLVQVGLCLLNQVGKLAKNSAIGCMRK